MRDFINAFELLRPGEIGLFISTDGTNLELSHAGAGKSGWWVLNPERPFDRVFVFKRGVTGEKTNEIYSARCTRFEGPEERRFELLLEDVRLEGTTQVNWTAFASASQNPIRYLEGPESVPEQIIESDHLVEGAAYRILVNAYERNPEARRRCLAHYGTNCSICQVDLSQVYGRIADGFIHVHHLRPLSEIGAEYRVDPVEDLRPVCPNCHAVLHRRVPVYSIEEVRALLGGRVVRAVKTET